MKNLLLVVVVIIVFFACATIGYNVATRFDHPQQADLPAPAATAGTNNEQYNMLIVQVNQLDAEKPELVSVWFISLFFQEDSAPLITFAQLYAPWSGTTSARLLSKTFSLDANGEPAQGFWKAIQSQKIKWDAYFVVDDFSVQRTLEWLNGPGDYISPLNTAADTNTLVGQICRSMAGINVREGSAFDWNGLAPLHFRSNLRMEIGMGYWNRVTGASKPVTCDTVLAR
jgi:hypothetical protein